MYVKVGISLGAFLCVAFLTQASLGLQCFDCEGSVRNGKHDHESHAWCTETEKILNGTSAFLKQCSFISASNRHEVGNNQSEYVLACFKERAKIGNAIRIKRNCKAIPRTKMPSGSECFKKDDGWKEIMKSTSVDAVPISEIEGVDCVCNNKDGCNSAEGKIASLFATLIAAMIAKIFA